MAAVVKLLYPIRERIAVSWLRGINAAMKRRIAAGDADFDDIVYRTRDATDTLLAIWAKPRQEIDR